MAEPLHTLYQALMVVLQNTLQGFPYTENKGDKRLLPGNIELIERQFSRQVLANEELRAILDVEVTPITTDTTLTLHILGDRAKKEIWAFRTSVAGKKNPGVTEFKTRARALQAVVLFFCTHDIYPTPYYTAAEITEAMGNSCGLKVTDVNAALTNAVDFRGWFIRRIGSQPFRYGLCVKEVIWED